MKCALRWSVVLMLATTLVAQTAAKKPVRKAAAPPAATAEDVQALRDALAAQQRQIQQLQQRYSRPIKTCSSRSSSCSRHKALPQMRSRRLLQPQLLILDQNDTVIKLSARYGRRKDHVDQQCSQHSGRHETVFSPRRRHGPSEDER